MKLRKIKEAIMFFGTVASGLVIGIATFEVIWSAIDNLFFLSLEENLASFYEFADKALTFGFDYSVVYGPILNVFILVFLLVFKFINKNSKPFKDRRLLPILLAPIIFFMGLWLIHNVTA